MKLSVRLIKHQLKRTSGVVAARLVILCLGVRSASDIGCCCCYFEEMDMETAGTNAVYMSPLSATDVNCCFILHSSL
jgi:hypothetical protein